MLIIRGNFAFQNGLGLTTNPNSPWAYIQEGVLLEGYLRLRFGGLIFWGAHFWRGLLWEFYGSGMYINFVSFSTDIQCFQF